MEIFKYKYDDLFNPTLKALHNLGGSASVSEIEEEVSIILKLTEEEINDVDRGNMTKLSYRLAWARHYLKRFGLLENSERGVWALTSKGIKTESVYKKEVKRKVKELDKFRKPAIEDEVGEESTEEIEELKWQESLLEILKDMPPDKFERLCTRVLREFGFVNVEITGKTGDGGIDGKGVVKIGGVLSFHVVFQCKRYKGSVPPSLIRDFRGAMVGRADKGLFITTGNFTREAKKEAQREGAPPIDLIDGFQLADSMKKLGLGIKVSMVERIEINNDWFENF